ncbi:hypothetical protein D910_02070, partial [Dendroctonus ponderosae]
MVKPPTALDVKTQVQKLFPTFPVIQWQRHDIDKGKIPTFTREELNRAASEMKNKKAPGPDSVPPEIVIESVKAQGELILRVFNKCLVDGNFPKIWKEARLVLIEKPGKDDRAEREKLEDGVEITGYVDDIALVVKAKDLEGLQDKASYKMGLISKKLNDMEIKIAPEKTQIVLVAGRRKIRTAEEHADDCACPENRKQGPWDNQRHDQPLTPKIGGPGAAKKRLLASTVQSVVLYGAKAWQKTLRYKGYNSLLDRVNRRLAICITAAYRTISTQVAQVLAGLPPLDLMVEERISIQEDGKASRKLHRTTLIRKWGDYKGWAKVFITDLNVWLQEERYKDVNHFVTQAISGH